MRLIYSKILPKTGATVVLVGMQAKRVEFYLRQSVGGVTLLALAGAAVGGERAVVSKSKLQGPYETVEQAVAARNAIAEALIEQGYHFAVELQPLWELDAQRVWAEVKAKNTAAAVDTRFKAEDVFLDW